MYSKFEHESNELTRHHDNLPEETFKQELVLNGGSRCIKFRNEHKSPPTVDTSSLLNSQ